MPVIVRMLNPNWHLILSTRPEKCDMGTKPSHLTYSHGYAPCRKSIFLVQRYGNKLARVVLEWLPSRLWRHRASKDGRAPSCIYSDVSGPGSPRITSTLNQTSF